MFRTVSQASSTVHIAIGIDHTGDAVCKVLDSWWWTEILSETCTALFQK